MDKAGRKKRPMSILEKRGVTTSISKGLSSSKREGMFLSDGGGKRDSLHGQPPR